MHSVVRQRLVEVSVYDIPFLLTINTEIKQTSIQHRFVRELSYQQNDYSYETLYCPLTFFKLYYKFAKQTKVAIRSKRKSYFVTRFYVKCIKPFDTLIHANLVCYESITIRRKLFSLSFQWLWYSTVVKSHCTIQ